MGRWIRILRYYLDSNCRCWMKGGVNWENINNLSMPYVKYF